MKNLKAKLRGNRKGFTLAELLIVVAIIGVLVAIAIPVFGGALDSAKEATDDANIRAAYAQYTITAMTGENYDAEDGLTAGADTNAITTAFSDIGVTDLQSGGFIFVPNDGARWTLEDAAPATGGSSYTLENGTVTAATTQS